ncbi:hypothetical protein D3C72_2262080 [compost metagenome]
MPSCVGSLVSGLKPVSFGILRVPEIDGKLSKASVASCARTLPAVMPASATAKPVLMKIRGQVRMRAVDFLTG